MFSDCTEKARVVADVAEQCAAIGELHHALDKKVMMKDQVHAELGEVIAGTKPGRTSNDEIIVFRFYGDGATGRGYRGSSHCWLALFRYDVPPKSIH